MGRPTADSSNLSRGWRAPHRQAPSTPKIQQPKIKTAAHRGTAFPTKNSHRAKNDCGLRQQRRY